MAVDDIHAFYRESISTVHEGSKATTAKILELLCILLNVRALSFYSYNPYHGKLILRAFHPPDTGGFSTFEQDAEESFVGRAVSERGIVSTRDIPTEKHFREKDRAGKHGLGSAVATSIPRCELDVSDLFHERASMPASNLDSVLIPNRDGESDSVSYQTYKEGLDVLGAICLYPRDETRLSQLHDELSNLTPFIASIYIASVRADKAKLRRRIIDTSLRKRDLNSFLYKAVHRANDYLDIEAASIFLWDSRSGLLKLHTSTGIETDLQKADVYYRPEESKVSVKVATNGHAILTSNIDDHMLPKKFPEIVEGVRKSYICVPIFNWGPIEEPMKAKPLGVLRAVNKKAVFMGQEQVVTFTWDDVSNLRFVAEEVGFVANCLRRSEEKMEEIERIMHGSRMGIKAIEMNLSHFESRPHLLELKTPHFRYIIPDSIAHAADLLWQIEKLTLTEDSAVSVQIEEVDLLNDVLSVIIALARSATIPLNVPRVRFEFVPNREAFEEIPSVAGNRESLQAVFRNVVENAMKYSKPAPNACDIKYSYRIDESNLLIFVTDHGIGLPEDVKNVDKWIFVDGFRGENAMRRRPAGGSGIGLTQSRERMQAMGGSLEFLPGGLGTTFVVRIPLWRNAEDDLLD